MAPGTTWIPPGRDGDGLDAGGLAYTFQRCRDMATACLKDGGSWYLDPLQRRDMTGLQISSTWNTSRMAAVWIGWIDESIQPVRSRNLPGSGPRPSSARDAQHERQRNVKRRSRYA